MQRRGATIRDALVGPRTGHQRHRGSARCAARSRMAPTLLHCVARSAKPPVEGRSPPPLQLRFALLFFSSGRRAHGLVPDRRRDRNFREALAIGLRLDGHAAARGAVAPRTRCARLARAGSTAAWWTRTSRALTRCSRSLPRPDPHGGDRPVRRPPRSRGAPPPARARRCRSRSPADLARASATRDRRVLRAPRNRRAGEAGRVTSLVAQSYRTMALAACASRTIGIGDDAEQHHDRHGRGERDRQWPAPRAPPSRPRRGRMYM